MRSGVIRNQDRIFVNAYEAGIATKTQQFTCQQSQSQSLLMFNRWAKAEEKMWCPLRPRTDVQGVRSKIRCSLTCVVSRILKCVQLLWSAQMKPSKKSLFMRSSSGWSFSLTGPPIHPRHNPRVEVQSLHGEVPTYQPQHTPPESKHQINSAH